MMMSSASGVWSKRPVLLCLCLVGLMLAVLSWNRPDMSMEPHAGSFAAAQQARLSNAPHVVSRNLRTCIRFNSDSGAEIPKNLVDRKIAGCAVRSDLSTLE
jgi:hypothetical protein